MGQVAVQPEEMMGKQAGPERGRQIGRGLGRVMKIGPAAAVKIEKIGGLARGWLRAGFCRHDYWRGEFECVSAIR